MDFHAIRKMPFSPHGGIQAQISPRCCNRSVVLQSPAQYEIVTHFWETLFALCGNTHAHINYSIVAKNEACDIQMQSTSTSHNESAQQQPNLTSNTFAVFRFLQWIFARTKIWHIYEQW